MHYHPVLSQSTLRGPCHQGGPSSTLPPPSPTSGRTAPFPSSQPVPLLPPLQYAPATDCADLHLCGGVQLLEGTVGVAHMHKPAGRGPDKPASSVGMRPSTHTQLQATEPATARTHARLTHFLSLRQRMAHAPAPVADPRRGVELRPWAAATAPATAAGVDGMVAGICEVPLPPKRLHLQGRAPHPQQQQGPRWGSGSRRRHPQ